MNEHEILEESKNQRIKESKNQRIKESKHEKKPPEGGFFMLLASIRTRNEL